MAHKAWYVVMLNKGIATYMVPACPGQGEAWAERVRTEPVPSKVSTPLAPWEGSLGPRTAWAWQPRAGAESSVLLSDCCAGRPAGGAGRGVDRKV